MRKAYPEFSALIPYSHTPLPRQNTFFHFLVPPAVHHWMIVPNHPCFSAFRHHQKTSAAPQIGNAAEVFAIILSSNQMWQIKKL